MTRRTLLAALAGCAALPVVSLAQSPGAVPIPVLTVSDKLGVKPSVNSPRELEPGYSATTMLADPKKLDPYIKGMHEGARVTISCIGPGRIRVEAEEMEPVEQRSTVTLHVAEDGSLTPAAERPPTPPKPPTPPR